MYNKEIVGLGPYAIVLFQNHSIVYYYFMLKIQQVYPCWVLR